MGYFSAVVLLAGGQYKSRGKVNQQTSCVNMVHVVDCYNRWHNESLTGDHYSIHQVSDLACTNLTSSKIVMLLLSIYLKLQETSTVALQVVKLP